MHFEDYNYEMYNRHLLINPDIDDYESSEAEDSEGVPKEKKLGFMPEQKEDEDNQVLHLTDKVIEQSVHESYKHSQLDVQTEEELVQAQQKAIEERIKEKNRLADEEDEARREEEEEKKNAEEGEDGEEKDVDEDEEDEEGDNKSEIEYDIFYDHKQIKRAYEEQKKDAFWDILDEKVQVKDEFFTEHEKPIQKLNKYNIDDWAPKEEVEIVKKKKKNQ